MFSMWLPNDLYKRLDNLARRTKRSKKSYVGLALGRYIFEFEKKYLAEAKGLPLDDTPVSPAALPPQNGKQTIQPETPPATSYPTEAARKYPKRYDTGRAYVEEMRRAAEEQG
jgi:hypothetical protein